MTQPTIASRKAKRALCGDCGAAVWNGLDADVAALPVQLDREPLTPAQCADAWPDLYVIRMGKIFAVYAPRRIDLGWEQPHTTHQCKGE